MRKDIRNKSLSFQLPVQRRVPHLVTYKFDKNKLDIEI